MIIFSALLLTDIGSPTISEGMIPSSLPLPPTPGSDLTPTKVLNILLTSTSTLVTPSSHNTDPVPSLAPSDIKSEGRFSPPKSSSSQSQGQDGAEKFGDRLSISSIKLEPMEVKQEPLSEVKQEAMEMSQPPPIVQTPSQPGMCISIR